jgi:hydrogenase maturation protein HypF
MIKKRLKVHITGAVQGVGFRPFIFRLARKLKLFGWVNNSSHGVFIEVEGTEDILFLFLEKIEYEKPEVAVIYGVESWFLDPVGYDCFQIVASEDGEKTTIILPDLGTCSDCLAEVFNRENRRYLYPFTNCTNCGPRFSIIQGIPYDRPSTTMGEFVMCDRCFSEYENPLDRRFHAQPNACDICGPHVELWNSQGEVLASHDLAIFETVKAILEGKILAIKGIGGFHLVVDATNNDVVERLRKLKRRGGKPLALLYPHLDAVKNDCDVSEMESKLLQSHSAPIVILTRKKLGKICDSVAPNNPYLGVMLPSNPLHHILIQKLNIPIVATSGNLSDEPICIDNQEALLRLGEIADLFLVHNRAIARPIDDSIVRVMMGREMMLRRGRGYAPLPVIIKNLSAKILAVGGHLKNTIAINVNEQVFISQHIGDLATKPAFDSFTNIIDSFKQLYQFQPEAIACDLHPHYLSTEYAENSHLPIIKVQHHYAHILATMAENDLLSETTFKPILGIAWDGTGYGTDGTIWGGEFLLINEQDFQRVAHFQTFGLLGGEKAVKEPRRNAIAMLYEIFGNDVFTMNDLAPIQAFTPQELSILKTMLNKDINTVKTSSVGRIFDAIASLLNICQISEYEGQAGMQLEFLANQSKTADYYEFEIINQEETLIIAWKNIIKNLLTDIKNKVKIPIIAAKFHNTLSEIILRITTEMNQKKVIITGGCFQNKYLTETTIKTLKKQEILVYWSQRIPANDGGIALGQIIAAQRELNLLRYP